jgi:hypothetical protein
MKHTLEEVEEKEVDFYVVSMEKAMDYAKHGKTEGTEIRQLIAMAGVVAKMRQTRGANRALDAMVARDKLGGSLPKQFQLENKA